ncbi:hypothetical protein PY254_00715 [Rhodanobacter sp. AS-Z3]|uniref:hypothetical protein n=1 Tax=Rhodanobacter sp. AS-Z3 TaxID=3031330 RepID=UPI002479E3D8|nr:hypothetical protein [Rhodanobacter sp. AS-Z3]WEN15235.1 hypothetical protein PY254_00715 [Rhodanobacter sp. AS-Z3]
MKLLHDFFRLHLAGRYTAGAALPGFSVTVPAPLAGSTADGDTLPTAALAVRREPASFLKAARHRRRGLAR